ncbi:unnamed protein product [Plutella xylostella]|uniref:(diamondback moth) hypothetical protein n=1 Tax=Plutella xylostella TaxID=51655 RepID=A0A8S4D958_PLUXY|nr:unnamed protein product [Plutella xylostella]
MLGISLVDRVSNVEIRRKTRVDDVGSRITRLKWRWAGHLVRRDDGRWTGAVTVVAKNWQTRNRQTASPMIEDGSRRNGGGTFLVPMNGGIWTMCVSLDEEELSMLVRTGFPMQPACTNYLASSDYEEPRADWQHRMQNLSISCALVCLIVLGSAALVGTFGVCKHQISAVLVTGVMYLLAGTFALFTLMIIHFKRIQRVSTRGSPTGDDTGDGVIGPRAPAMALLSAREFSTSWSLDLGWGGVALATMTSLLWILLSKIMRYNPISSMLL